MLVGCIIHLRVPYLWTRVYVYTLRGFLHCLFESFGFPRTSVADKQEKRSAFFDVRA